MHADDYKQPMQIKSLFDLFPFRQIKNTLAPIQYVNVPIKDIVDNQFRQCKFNKSRI